MSKVLEKTTIYRNTAVNNTAKSIPCPRCMNDVYAIGTHIQYHVGDICLQLADINMGDQRKQYIKMAIKQSKGKNQILTLANAHLNELQWYFYNNGGRVIEDPVSKKQAREIQPFFNRIMDNFLERLDALLKLPSKVNMSAGEIEIIINEDIIDMYANLSRLFQVDEIVYAFDQLISIKNNVR